MTHRNEQRRERRVAFSGFVRLRGLGEEESVEAEILNISALGMFVASKKVPRPGAAVFCRVIFGNDRRIIKGKVAWVAPGAPAATGSHVGAGIEFVDLSQKDSEVLRTVLDASTSAPPPASVPPADSDDLGHVEVQFEGLAGPVRARARVTQEGIVLTTKLPFLRVGSDVTVRFASSEVAHQSRSGRLQAVCLGSTGADGVPRLLVELSAAQDEARSTPSANKLWQEVAPPVPPVRLEIDTEPQTLTLPLHAHNLRARAMPDTELTDPDITPAVQSAPPAHDVHLEVDLASSPTPLSVEAAGPEPAVTLPGPCPVPPEGANRHSAVAIVRAATAGSSSIEVNLTPLPESAPRSDLPPGPLHFAPPPVSEPTLRVESGMSLPYAPRSEGATTVPWKMLAGAAVAAAAVAFLAVQREEAKPPRSPAPPIQEREDVRGGIRIEPLPARAQETPLAIAKAPAATNRAVAVQAQKTVLPAPGVSDENAWRPLADPSWPFTVAAEGETTTVFIPLTGNFAEARVYDLSNPGGVGALLPAGDLPKASGKFTINEVGITQVWAEQRETGVHLRVLFGRNVLSHTARLEADGLRVVATRRP